MTAREFLRRYKAAVIRADLLREEYKEQARIIDTIRSPLGGDGIHTGRITKTVEEQAVRLALRAERYKEAQLEAVRIRQEIIDTLKRLEPYAAAVLYNRYILFKAWDEVATAVGYSLSQIYRLHRDGLQQVETIIGE